MLKKKGPARAGARETRIAASAINNPRCQIISCPFSGPRAAQVWATDLWFSASENIRRIRDAGVDDGIFPLHADARSLPFSAEFFDVIVCLDSYPYFGADDLYLNYVAHFLKPGGRIGIAGAGLTQEVEGVVPEHLKDFWTQSLWAFHSAAWWRRHWERTGIVEVEIADTMPDGWRLWLDWQRRVARGNAAEINPIENDGGRFITWARVVGRRLNEMKLEEFCWPDTLRTIAPIQYTKKPMLLSEADDISSSGIETNEVILQKELGTG